MKNWKIHIPPGVQDYLPDECYNKRKIEEKIRRIFYLNGYDEIETPIFEYFDVFTGGKSSIEQEQMYKFFEIGGRILVLRPDNTMPIARIAATKMKNASLPLRLSYISSIYRYEEMQYGKQREVAQAGMELLGVEGPEGDAEVISTAVQILLELGLKEFQIDIGQVDFFKGLIEEAGLDEEQSEEIRSLIDHKNMLGLEVLLRKFSFSSKVKEILLNLPKIYGNADMLKKARNLSLSPRCRNAIDNLEEVYGIIQDYGLGNYITFDLGMVQSLKYYTGMIFRGMTRELGYPICAGGRYDGLASDFGYDLPATGFALGIKRILMVLERQRALEKIPGIDYLVVVDQNVRSIGYSRMQALRKAGNRVEYFIPSKECQDPLAYARKKGIRRVLIVQARGTTEVVIDSLLDRVMDAKMNEGGETQ